MTQFGTRKEGRQSASESEERPCLGWFGANAVDKGERMTSAHPWRRTKSIHEVILDLQGGHKTKRGYWVRERKGCELPRMEADKESVIYSYIE